MIISITKVDSTFVKIQPIEISLSIFYL